jgi:glutamyl-tRNA synthetase
MQDKSRIIMKNVRTRIAPSPTGYPHIGTIYQVLFDFAFARKNNGTFILRIEDTDRNRFVEGAEEVIYKALDWFGLTPDESPEHLGAYGPYRQSERLTIYKKHVDDLVVKGHAYRCFCTKERLEQMRKGMEERREMPMYDRKCRNLSQDEIQKQLGDNVAYVVRMKIPDDRKIAFDDLIMGKIEVDSSTVDDQVILKSDGFPTYHLGVVVDDHLMEISHVFRGREWVSSTPKHVLLYEYFGWEMPFHAHLPLILNSDGKGKLSKRHGHASVDYYREGGFLPEAVLNYLSNIVWNHPEGKEIYDLEEFIKLFDITQFSSQGARFDLQKLTWMNQQYIQNMNDDELLTRIINFYPDKNLDEALVRSLLPLLKTRMETLKDFQSLTEFFFQAPTIIPRSEVEREIVGELISVLNALSLWTVEGILPLFKAVLEKYSVRMPVLYYLLTGLERGLPLPESLVLLNKDETLRRLQMI